MFAAPLSQIQFLKGLSNVVISRYRLWQKIRLIFLFYTNLDYRFGTSINSLKIKTNVVNEGKNQ